ncbi:MAG: hypothetical protein WCX82_03525 [archaeon]|jgi:hypothetical protein
MTTKQIIQYLTSEIPEEGVFNKNLLLKWYKECNIELVYKYIIFKKNLCRVLNKEIKLWKRIKIDNKYNIYKKLI